MVEGAFSFLLFIFSSPQQAIVNQLEGHWLVTIDNTELAREWNRVYYFEKCKVKKGIGSECEGSYGWAEYEGVYLNLYDRNFITYDVDKREDQNSGKRRIRVSGIEYDFVLNTSQKTLFLMDTDSGDQVMVMKKISKSEIKRSKKNQLITTS